MYDGESKRAKKTGPGGATYYFSNEFEIIDNVETKYIFAGNLRIAKVTDVPVYFHKDHLGSSTAMTDGSGSVSDTAMYMPFGGKRGSDEISVSSYKFTDQELDKASGLYNYDARLYDPVVGRFMSPDSIVPGRFDSQAFDRYAYTLNNPIKYTDPNGHAVLCTTLAAYGVYEIVVSGVAITATITLAEWLDNLFNEARDEETKESEDLPNAPPPNDGNAKPHGNEDHDKAINDYIDDLKDDKNVSNIRKNQQQTDVNGKKVGKNRPDVQNDRYDPETKETRHKNTEFDRNQRNSDKHKDKILENDPDSDFEGTILE